MRALSINGVTLHVQDTESDGAAGAATRADGHALVFINSLGTDARIWDGVAARLPGNLRVIRYDKRGHGLSDCPPGDWGMDAHIDDLLSLLDSLGVAKASLVGLSIGGVISLGLAARAPERLATLTLICTAARIGTVESWSERMAAIAEGGLAAIADSVMERWLPPAYRAEAPEFPLYRNMLLQTPLHGYLRSCAGLRDSDFTAVAEGLDLPCQAIAGELDASTPPDLVKHTCDLIPNARFTLFSGASHLPCIDQPARSAETITTFLKETGHV